MQFKSLENTSIADLVHVFNEAFSDYIIPMHLTKEQLLNKIIAESIQRKLSFGAFDGDKLVGFILHGTEIQNGEKIAYNGGTGVIPERRGKNLTSQLYDHSLPILKKAGINKILLEVISDNHKAFNTYSKIGFKKNRTLNCYKGSIADFSTDSSVHVQHIYQPDWNLLKTFWNWAPSWQNSVTAINNSWSLLDTIGIFNDDKLVGYVVCNPKLNKILQFAIDKNFRKTGLGKQLFQYYALNKSKSVSLNNIDSGDVETNSFLTSTGLKMYLQQEEMQLSFLSE